MKDALIDTEIEIPLDEIAARQGVDDGLAKEIMMRLRQAADDAVVTAGPSAWVRTDVLPEIAHARKASPLIGGDLLLVRARWHVVVPDSFDPERLRS